MSKIRPRITSEEYELIKEFRGIKTVSKETNMPIEEIDFYWDKTKRYSTKIQNRFYKPRSGSNAIKEIDFESIFKDKVTPIKVLKQPERVGLFDRVVYTDVHLAMNPNPDGYSLYGGKWDEDEVDLRLAKMVNHTLSKQDSNILYLDELGDFMDGWNGQTTRGGHDLPQNMDNQKAFDVGFRFKIRLIDALMKNYDKIVCHNVCNDNHAGAFGYVVNSAFKTYIELKYADNVEVINQRKFIDHYTVGKYTFILTHGKDAKDLKFGFKPHLDDKQSNKIKGYIDEHFLYTKDSIIEFSKGDSHQYLFDNSSSDSFNYYNYPALSPSSSWVQTNFKKGLSGFVQFSYYEDDTRAINECLFKWKK